MAEQPTRSQAQGRRRRGRVLLVAIGCVVVLVAAGVAGGLISRTDADSSSSASSSDQGACPATRVASRGLPSVVMLSVQSPSGAGTGSGEVISDDGEILTNNHVISAAANGGTISVLFSDGETADATIVGRDPQTDLAVVKATTKHKVPVIRIGSSQGLAVGEPVVALGAPLGFPNTVTSGIVSALDRSVQVPADGNSTALLVAAIQTDAAINPGNSGGALVNCDAQLVGVPTAGATIPSPVGGSNSGNIGIGFAIPADFALKVAHEIIATGAVTHSFLGIQVAPAVSGANARGADGLFVVAVTPGGPSAAAGLRPGDLITKIDGTAASSAEQLQALTLTKKPGAQVHLSFTREGSPRTATVTLVAAP
jgi:putative serine protease PepD